MKKKIIVIIGIVAILGIMLFVLTGCGNNKNESDKTNVNISNQSSLENNNKESKDNIINNTGNIENNSIKETATNYYTYLYHADSKTAYKYVDFVGLIAWVKKENSIPKNFSTTFFNKYNEILNDSEQVNKILEHFNNEDMYLRINKEITYKDVNVEVTDEEDLGNNLYKARVKALYNLNGTNTGSDKTLYFMKKDNKFYIIDDSALWAKKDITDLIGMF